MKVARAHRPRDSHKRNETEDQARFQSRRPRRSSFSPSLKRTSNESTTSRLLRISTLLRNNNRPRTLNLTHLDTNDLIQHRSRDDSESFGSRRDVDVFAFVSDSGEAKVDAHAGKESRNEGQFDRRRLGFLSFLFFFSRLTSPQEKPAQPFHFQTFLGGFRSSRHRGPPAWGSVVRRR